ncbi:MAG: flagellar protein FlaG [Ectothiorhodospiraceae bacterium]|nr:flagellar protein FlaG [Ectothiorhodospiraceae bacterium]
MDKAVATLLTPVAAGLSQRITDGPARPQNLVEADRNAPPVQEHAPEAPVRVEDVDTAVREINEFVQIIRRDLQFSVDEHSGRTVITVLDSETQEIVRQIPPEKLMKAAENIEQLRGLLFDAEA